MILEKHRHFFIFDEDRLEVPAVVQPKFYYWLNKNKIDITYPRVYQAQYKTHRHPYLVVDELRNIDLSDTLIVPDTFFVEGRVFKVFKNCMEKFDAEYNFMIILVGHDPYRFTLKVCFSKLDEYNLINRRIRFNLKRIGTSLVLQGYQPIDIDEPTEYGIIEME